MSRAAYATCRDDHLIRVKRRVLYVRRFRPAKPSQATRAKHSTRSGRLLPTRPIRIRNSLRSGMRGAQQLARESSFRLSSKMLPDQDGDSEGDKYAEPGEDFDIKARKSYLRRFTRKASWTCAAQ
jgi:hypothetical protein